MLRVASVALLLLVAGGCTSDKSEGRPPARSDVTSESKPSRTLSARFAYDVQREFVDPTNCPARSVQFKDTSLGSPTGWRWDFGDGSTSSERNPLRDPPSRAGEAVTLTVTQGDESASVTKVVNYGPC